jgi:hypothetical protein
MYTTETKYEHVIVNFSRNLHFNDGKIAKELDCLDVIINDTLTDYNGNTNINEWGMGVNNNPATELRVKGFYEAKQNGWI